MPVTLHALLATSSGPPGRLARCGIGPLLGFARFLSLRQRAALVDLDGRKAALGDAQREWSFVFVTAPDRQ